MVFSPKRTRLVISNSDVVGSPANFSFAPVGLNNTEAVADAQIKLDSYSSSIDKVTFMSEIVRN